MSRPLETEFAGRTFDDFLFRPQQGVAGSRRAVSLRARLVGDLELELPLVSANMDSTTGADMATAMALAGGVGVLHRALPYEPTSAREMLRTTVLGDEPIE